ncbi:hypothetical protein ERJ75_001012300 [Trypanosoma vivax]|uniref:Uncharacterized protein n=1 Tax=Trypanosoma vivax (strain Y486) TaxID=1055687 RepID=G0U252_TRYVY|nr:hypothetical protein TRVL_08478 [Trypanosoma vivax]KAH8611594.1 hypothetical protein ERJ75_001012300 [Trypanosoma vivax]CCC50355.1 conserved hypothetical protein [Trypanosoma vivax Y486]
MRRCWSFDSFGCRTPLLVGASHVRHHINGFSLFVKELQEKEGLLTADSLQKGQGNMRLMSQHWKNLTKEDRNRYNKRAREMAAIKVQDNTRSFSDFNILMRLVHKSKEVGTIGDESFTSHMVRNTMSRLKSPQKAVLRQKYSPKTVAVEQDTSKQFQPLSWLFPPMRYFESFCEMLQAVAPTQKDLFVAVSRTVKCSRNSYDTMVALERKFDSLKAQDREKFKPITEEDAAKFEKYCAYHCATFYPERFDIVRLFAQFRGLAVAKTALPEPEATQYRMLMEADRFRESLYFKALRNLERAKAGRSADHGTYISHFHPEGVPIPPKTYKIQSELNDVEIATMLAETRFGRSVYDDVVERTRCFRPLDSNRLLEDTYLAPASAPKKKLAKPDS